MSDQARRVRVPLELTVAQRDALRALADAQGRSVNAFLRAMLDRVFAAQGIEAEALPDERKHGRRSTFLVRLDPADGVRLRKEAEITGRSSAGLVRAILRRAFDGAPVYTADELAMFRKAFDQLRRVGSNLNQLLHHANRTADPSGALAYISEVQSTIKELRDGQRLVLDRASNRYQPPEAVEAEQGSS